MTINSFLDSLDKAKANLGCSNGSAWYRGQTDRWDLSPSLMRFYALNGIDPANPKNPENPVDPREEGFFNEFLFRCPELSLKNISSWELLALMQHYGTPTRLLDWTENLFIAVYFSLSSFLTEKEALRAPCVFVTNPYKLTKAAINTSPLKDELPLAHRNDGLRLIEITALEAFDYAKSFLAKGAWWFKTPLPIASPWQNERIFAQQGFFTVHGTDPAPLNRQRETKDFIRRVDIPKEAVPEFQRIFQAMNLNHYSLFRDYESLSAQLRIKFSKKPKASV